MRLGGRRVTGNKILSTSASIIDAVASRPTNCVGGSLRGVINLRARGPLGHNLGICNNVHVTRATLGSCNCRVSPRLSRFCARRHGARGRNIFSTCSSSVHVTEHGGVIAKLPSTCNHKQVVPSFEHVTLCNISCLGGRGLGS